MVQYSKQSSNRRLLKHKTNSFRFPVPVANKHVHVSPPQVLVLGRNASLTASSDSYPEPVHRCWLDDGQEVRELALLSSTKTSVKDWKRRTVIRMVSTFQLAVSPGLANGTASVACQAREASGKVTVELGRVSIPQVSEPCTTAINLSLSRQPWMEGEVRKIRVVSSGCSHWSVSHNCWLMLPTQGAGGILARTEKLRKVSQRDYHSQHEITIDRRMALSGGSWAVRCSVNQSGLAYPSVYSSGAELPQIYYSAKLSLGSQRIEGRQLILKLVSTESSNPVAQIEFCNLLVLDGENATKIGMRTSSQSRGSRATWTLTCTLPQGLHRACTFVARLCCSAHQEFSGISIEKLNVTTWQYRVPVQLPGEGCNSQGFQIPRRSNPLSTQATVKSELALFFIFGLCIATATIGLIALIVQQCAAAAATSHREAILSAGTAFADGGVRVLPRYPYPSDNGTYAEEVPDDEASHGYVTST